MIRPPGVSLDRVLIAHTSLSCLSDDDWAECKDVRKHTSRAIASRCYWKCKWIYFRPLSNLQTHYNQCSRNRCLKWWAKTHTVNYTNCHIFLPTSPVSNKSTAANHVLVTIKTKTPWSSPADTKWKVYLRIERQITLSLPADTQGRLAI